MKIKTTMEIYNTCSECSFQEQMSKALDEFDGDSEKWVSVDSLLKWIDEQTPIFDDNCSKGVDIEDLKEALKGQLRPSNVRTR